MGENIQSGRNVRRGGNGRPVGIYTGGFWGKVGSGRLALVLLGHLVNVSEDYLFFQLTDPAAAVAGQKPILAVIPITQDDYLLDAAVLKTEGIAD